jgi:hypothetical protein
MPLTEAATAARKQPCSAAWREAAILAQGASHCNGARGMQPYCPRCFPLQWGKGHAAILAKVLPIAMG